MGKLGYGYPEIPVGGVRIDPVKYQLGVEVIESRSIGGIIGIGSGHLSRGHDRDGDAPRCRQDQQGEQKLRGRPVGERIGDRRRPRCFGVQVLGQGRQKEQRYRSP